jgi:hypothetical protein
MQIIDTPEDTALRQQMAELLVLGFQEHWDAWATTEEALAELEEILAKGFARVALDAEDDMTTLAGRDLYENLWDSIAHIRNLKGHPYEFYAKLGYTITGVVPDANGRGKPDIIMGKRIEGENP